MKPHEQRVVDEHEALKGKIVKLTAFYETPVYAALCPYDKTLLLEQGHHMRAYASVLAERIARFIK